MTAWIACALALSGWAALSWTMDRHHEQAYPEHVPTKRQHWQWRTLGCVGLALSLWVCALRWSPSVATAAWLGILSFAGLALALLYTYAPQRVRAAAAAAGVLGLCGLLTLAGHAR